jgi:hypothetical protein
MRLNQIILSGIILSLSLGISIFLISGALAQIDDPADIQYPVKELGNCKNETECRAYCNNPQNMEVCLDFAEEHNLISEDELAMARKFIAAGASGPGGCESKDSCEAYCNDVSHIDECLAYAEENDLLPPDELKEARQVQAALKKGAQLPGGCRNKDDCEAYCEDPDHMEECIAFGEAAGFIPPDELKEARMALEAVKKGAKAPPCRGRAECDDYCGKPDHFKECITFAEAAGFISKEDAKMARKTGGKGPGGCRGRECKTFCEDENNFQVCMDFAVEHGMMSEEEAEMARKTGGKGPGGCKGREECEAFCQNPANQETCFNFAKEHGLISEEDLERMEEGKEQMREAFEMATPEVMECLNSALGAEMVEKLKAGTAMPSPAVGDAMRACFEQMMGEMGPPGGPGEMPEGMPEGMPGGPGGRGVPMDIQDMPPEVADCLKSAVGEEVWENFKSRKAPPPRDLGEKMRSCIEEFKSQMMKDGGRPMPMPGPMPLRKGMEPPEGMPERMPREMPEGRPTPEQRQQIMQEQFQQKMPQIMPQGAPPELQQQIQQQMEQQMRQQIEQQMRQQMRPPETQPQPPQSQLNPPKIGELLMGLLSNLLF